MLLFIPFTVFAFLLYLSTRYRLYSTYHLFLLYLLVTYLILFSLALWLVIIFFKKTVIKFKLMYLSHTCTHENCAYIRKSHMGKPILLISEIKIYNEKTFWCKFINRWTNVGKHVVFLLKSMPFTHTHSYVQWSH